MLAESPAHFLRERVRNNALTILPLLTADPAITVYPIETLW